MRNATSQSSLGSGCDALQPRAPGSLAPTLGLLRYSRDAPLAVLGRCASAVGAERSRIRQSACAAPLPDRRRGSGFPGSQRPNHTYRTKTNGTPRGIPSAHGIAARIQGHKFNPAVILFKQRQFRRLLQRPAKRFLLP